MNRDIIAFTKYKFNVYGNKDIRSGKDSAVVGIVGKSKSLDFPTMLIFWSLVRNSVVLAVYLLFSVACFLTVHEHFAKGSNTSAPSEPSKEGYTFKGWYTAADGGEKVNFASMTFDSAATLYAHWEPVIESSVTVPAISGRVGEALTPVTAVVVNAKAGGTWSAENLPAGLVIDPATGVISGTPTGVHNFKCK